MIVELIILGLMKLFILVFTLFSFVNVPGWLSQGLDSAIDFMMIPFGVVSNYIGSEFLTFILLLLVTVFPVYYGFLVLRWILTRIGVLK